jgi:hypothetical protein
LQLFDLLTQIYGKFTTKHWADRFQTLNQLFKVIEDMNIDYIDAILFDKEELLHEDEDISKIYRIMQSKLLG